MPVRMSKLSKFQDKTYIFHPMLSLSVDIVMMFLALAGLFILLREIFTPLTAEEHIGLVQLDTAICAVFLAEYAVRSHYCGSWRGYFRHHWYDLLGSIPVPFTALTPFRWLRLLRLMRLLTIFFRLRKSFGTARKIKAVNVLAYTIIVAGSIIFLCAMLMYWIESSVNPDIQNFFDSLWWSIITVTTVGYGDTVPVTAAGRIVAMTLMISGIGIIGSLAASMASIIICSRSQDGEHDRNDITGRLEKLAALREKDMLSKREYEEAKKQVLAGTFKEPPGRQCKDK